MDEQNKRTFIEVPLFTKRWKEQSNLSDEEKNVLKKLVKALRDETAKNRGK